MVWWDFFQKPYPWTSYSCLEYFQYLLGSLWSLYYGTVGYRKCVKACGYCSNLTWCGNESQGALGWSI